MHRADTPGGKALHQSSWRPVLGAVDDGQARHGFIPSDTVPAGQNWHVPLA